jgi:diaminopimelate epimerase
MMLEFSKMHGLGNDFVVIDAINQAFTPSAEQVRRLADRHRGIGCDQVLLVERPGNGPADFRYRIFNADGGEVSQCGNGARCFMRFVHDAGLSNKRELHVGTASGLLLLALEDDGQVTVNMGVPRLEPREIPFDAPSRALDREQIEIAALSMGNPHAVTLVRDVEATPVERLGPLIGHHTRFPQGVNAGFMQIIDMEHIRLRVYERGAGETLACGSGACAAVVAGRLWDQLTARVNVTLRGGDLVVSWAGRGKPVYMTGSATYVFRGRIEI